MLPKPLLIYGVYGVLMSSMLTKEKPGNFSLRLSESSAHSAVSVVNIFYGAVGNGSCFIVLYAIYAIF